MLLYVKLKYHVEFIARTFNKLFTLIFSLFSVTYANGGDSNTRSQDLESSVLPLCYRGTTCSLCQVSMVALEPNYFN